MKKKEIWFYIGIYLLMIKMISNCTNLFSISPAMQNFMQVVIILCFFVRIGIEGFTFKELLIKGAIIIITFINYRLCDESGIFMLAVAIMAAKNMDVNKIIKNIAIPMTIYMIILIGLYIIGYFFDIESLEVMIRKSENGNIIRHSFFYFHPNVFAEHLTWVFIMWLYLKYEKINIVSYLMTTILALFLYYFPNSRTNAVILVLVIFISYIFKKFNGNRVKWVQKNIFNICLITSVILMLFCNTNNLVINKINSLLSGRIKLGWYTNKLFGITLFGQVLPIGENVKITQYLWIKPYALDNFYYRILYANGIIVTVLYMFFINKGLKLLVKDNKSKELFFLTILCIFGLSENAMSNIIIAFPLFFLANLNNGEDRDLKKNNEIKVV